MEKKRMTLAGTNPVIEARDAPVITGSEVTVSAPEVPEGVKPTGKPQFIPLTTAEQNPTADQPLKATPLESMGAGMGGMAINVYRASRGALIYDRDPNFDPDQLSQEFFTAEGAGTPEEIKYLANAKNEND